METVRVAELLAGLSLISDIGMGHAPDEAVRTCLLATRLGSELGLPDEAVTDTYFTALLQHVGCTASARDLSLAFGDDVAVNRAGSRTDSSRPTEVLFSFLPQVTAGLPLLERVRVTANVLVRGNRIGDAVAHANCEVGSATARRLGLSEGVQQALYQAFEWWNGKGTPAGLRHDEIALPTRLVHVASQAVLFAGLGGAELAAEVLRRRSGSYLDPVLAEEGARRCEGLLGELEEADVLAAVGAAEPEPHRTVSELELDDVARAFGDVVDLKSPFFHGHSARVGELAEAAARELNLGEKECVALRRAGFLHDVGRAGVPTSIWEKPGSLTGIEWEQVRLHAYNGERVLARSGALAPLAPLAGMHHERQDGSGYHRGLPGRSIPVPARVLAAADTFVALTQERPHRAALDPRTAGDRLLDEARHGRLDPDAADAVRAAAGLARPKRRAFPAGLTAREVEVLRLVTQSLSNAEIARRLVISPRTAEHHVQHIYGKIGVSTRAGATLYALEHDLLA